MGGCAKQTQSLNLSDISLSLAIKNFTMGLLSHLASLPDNPLNCCFAKTTRPSSHKSNNTLQHLNCQCKSENENASYDTSPR